MDKKCNGKVTLEQLRKAQEDNGCEWDLLDEARFKLIDTDEDGKIALNGTLQKSKPQFKIQESGSQSQNFNCHFGGCGNIPGMQQIHGGQVFNHGSNFNQDYQYGSHATNIGRKKRSPQFYQSFAPGSANVNCDSKGCGPAHMYPGTTSMATQMMTNWNPFAQKPQQVPQQVQQVPQQVQQYAQQVQQYPQQVQPGFMHFGQLPQKPAATIME